MEELKTFKELVPDWEGGRLKTDEGRYLFAYGNEGLKIWIGRALRKENKRLFYEGLGKNYGHEIYRLMGRPLNGECVSLVFAQVEECLLANPYIKSVSLLEYSAEGSALNMTLEVNTVYDRMEITEVIEIE